MREPDLTPWPVAGGESGAAIRGHDWSGTALGAPAGWPAALRFAISQMLASRMQVALFWGSDLLTFHNDAFAAGVGITDRQAPGLPLERRARSSWGAVFRPQIEAVRASGVAVWAEDVALVTSSAETTSVMYCDVSFDPVRDDDAAIVGVLCFASDTTARVLAAAVPMPDRVAAGAALLRPELHSSIDRESLIRGEDTGLREREARYRSALNSMDEGFCIAEVEFDAEGRAVDHRILEANPAFERHTGVTNPVGKSASELVPGGEQYWNDLYGRVVTTGISERVENGSEVMQRWFAVFVARVGDAADRTVAIVFTDVSARREAQRKMVFVMDSMPQKIFTALPDATIGYLNPQWMQYTGLSDDAVRDWSRAGLIHPEDLPQSIDTWTRGITLGEPIQIEHRFQRADGDYRWHISRALPMRDAQGQIVMWVGSSTDVHEQKQTAHDLERTMAALSAADQRKDEFLAMLAHELRNPLAPIRNALQIAQLADRREDDVSAALAIMNRQTGQMVRLVDELLDVSRISRGMLDLQRETVDLALVLEQAVETCRPAISAARHDLVLQLPSAPVLLSADVVRLTQVFGNLLNNAAKYTEPEGRIWLTAAREGDEAVVSIRDTGIGIADDMLRDVFQMFRQVDHSHEHSRGGLGIGLSLVERLVSLHGGSVTASSAGRGQGSEFVVRLPAIPASAALPPALQPAPESIVKAAVRRRRVLVVDDNQDSADSMAAYLDMTGNVTATAYDGMQALETAMAFRPDLVLLDLGMPRLDGYETASRMRELTGGVSMVLVALSGWGQESDRQKTTNAGFDAHLVKPVDFAALESLLAGLPDREAHDGD